MCFVGSSVSLTAVDDNVYSCPHCHAPNSTRLVVKESTFRLCFIPLGKPERRNPMYRCENCRWAGPPQPAFESAAAPTGPVSTQPIAEKNTVFVP